MYYATAEQMSRLDDLAVEHGLQIGQMMELAGGRILDVLDRLEISLTQDIVVVVGKGNKGGDGLCAARHLVNHGHHVTIVMLSEDLSTDSRHQYELLKKMKMPAVSYGQDRRQALKAIRSADLVIDALIGYRLRGSPRGEYGIAIEAINESGNQVIAYDIPTGIEASTGECLYPCIQATGTLTLGLPKKAFLNLETRRYAGRLFLGDIGIPTFLYDKMEPGVRSPFLDTSRAVIELDPEDN